MLRATPGGQIPPAQVVGRDRLTKRLWRVLEGRSLVLTAERRIGKTTVLRKMQAEKPEGLVVFYRDVEGLDHPLEFVERIFVDVEQHLSGKQRAANRVRQFLSKMAGAEIGSVVKFPEQARSDWKVVLEHLMDDLAENSEGLVVFFWDEMPLMLYKFKQEANEAAAIAVLDCLRSLRQRHARIRMVFTGSIGLHYVLTALKRAGSANDPTNDMQSEEVTPLAPGDGEVLALKLLEGEKIAVSDARAVAAVIAAEVDCFPFYIHHVVDRMTDDDAVHTPESVRGIVAGCIRDGNDPWHLRHYRERIDTYYPDPDRSVALELLDILATAETPLRLDELFNLLKSRMDTEDRELARDVLALLRRDHYVERKEDGAYAFRFSLIRRWWRFDRGL